MEKTYEIKNTYDKGKNVYFVTVDKAREVVVEEEVVYRGGEGGRVK